MLVAALRCTCRHDGSYPQGSIPSNMAYSFLSNAFIKTNKVQEKKMLALRHRKTHRSEQTKAENQISVEESYYCN